MHSGNIKKQQQGLLAVLAIVGALLVSSPAFACECPPKPSLEQSLKSSDVVFVGRVAELGKSPFKPGKTQVKMVVFSRFKGFEDLPKTEYTTIYTPSDKKACGFNFQSGFEYLVFANGTPASFKTSSCQRTSLLDNALADQEKLANMTKKKK